MSEIFHERIELERPPYFISLVHTKPIYISKKHIYKYIEYVHIGVFFFEDFLKSRKK